MDRRQDAWQKVTGRARFTGDLRVPGMLCGKLVRSTVPHARIVGVDTARALAIPGVVCVLLPDDVAGLGLYGHAVKDRPVLAQGVARYIGDPVAAVAAETPEAAQEAAEAIEIRYEPLPAALNIDEALREGAPSIHAKGNYCVDLRIKDGDLAQGWAKAVHVREDVFQFPSTYQYAMEPHTMLAYWRGRRLTVWSTAQHPFQVQRELAEMFALPLSQVRVAVPFIGGGFGSKSYTKYEPVAAALARKAGRPVRMEFSVEEAILTNRRHDARIWAKTGVDADGRIVAREAKVWLDTGGYADNGPRVANSAIAQLVGCYEVPAFDVEAIAVYTNKSPAGSFRSIGKPQTVWALETQLNRIARDIGLDPVELRRRNLAPRGTVLRPGELPLSVDLRGDLDTLADEGGYGPLSGIACATAGAGASPVSVAMVRLHPDGSATVQAASSELGQGAKTVFASIASRELDIAPELIAVVSSDTDLALYDRSTGASRSTTVMGRAVQAACRDARRQVGGLKTAQEVIGVGYSGPHEGVRVSGKPVLWETGMALAEADADPETGVVTVRRYVSVADLGKAIQPELCEGQEWGSATHALGHTLFESLEWRDGQLINGSLVDYRVPTFEDMLEDFTSVLVENEDGPGPYGSTGVGEGGVPPFAAAVAGALERRYGVTFSELPLTPERVWRTLESAGGKARPVAP